MKKQFLFLLLLGLLCSVGNAWGAEVTISPADGAASSYYFDADGTAITAIAGSGAKSVGYNSGTPKITVDGKNNPNATFAFTIDEGVTITSFQVNGTANNNTTYALDGAAVTFGTALTGLSKTGSMSFVLTCTDAASSSSNRNTTISSFTLEYTTSGGGGSSYTVTYKSGEGSGDDVVVSPATTIAGCPNTFSAPSNKAFAGWKDEDGTSYSVGDDVEEDLTLIAQWEFAPSEDVLFSIAMGSESLSSVTQNTEIDLSTNSYATISGGSASLGNKSSDDSKAQISSSNGVFFNGNDAYVKIVLGKALMTGDVITFTNPANDKQICFTTTNVRAESEATSSNKYTCTSTFNGISTIYVWRAATGSTYIKNLSIKRKVYARTAPTGNWGTICLPFAVSADAVTASGATFYSINGVRRSGETPTSIVLEEADELVAGNHYIFYAASDFTLPYTSGSTAAQTINGLVGKHSRFAFAEMDVENVYVVSGGQIKHATTSSGVEAYRAYIQMDAVSAPSAAPGRRIIEMPLEGNSATGVNEIESADKAVKFVENGRILILRDGITYDALGRIVK